MDYAALSNNRCVSDQLGTFGRRRIHAHVTGDKTQRVEHALLEQLTLFPNASIVLEDLDTHRSNFRRRVNVQTKRRQSHVNAGTVPESENAGRSTCGRLYIQRVRDTHKYKDTCK